MYNIACDAGFVTWSLSDRRLQIVPPCQPSSKIFASISFPVYPYHCRFRYESEENYTKLAEQGMMLTSNRPTMSAGKTPFQKDIGKFQNMDYDAKNDVFYCHNHCKLTL